MNIKFLFFLFFSTFSLSAFSAPITVAIDPGHGGKDPGAIGRNLHIYEKNITLAIAKELKLLLDKDPNFRGVLTRNGDYYISVPERSEIARKFKANYLISIHADSSESKDRRGASVWVLSNRRAHDEMGQWLENDEKRSELLGGAGKVLSNRSDKYLDQTVLDLQFGHSQRIGYLLGNNILKHFAKIAKLSRNTPQHASLGVLRSPDIPSVLVETGFLSNAEEEQKLNTPTYRRRVAYMIYEGLVAFQGKKAKPFVEDTKNITQEETKTTKDEKNKPSKAKSDEPNVKDSGIRHKVKRGESLGSLANKYRVKTTDIIELNKIKRKDLWIDEIIKIPESKNKVNQQEKQPEKEQNKASQKEKKTEKTKKSQPIYHTIEKNQTLSEISKKYKISVNDILKLNPGLKENKIFAGKKIKIQEN